MKEVIRVSRKMYSVLRFRGLQGVYRDTKKYLYNHIGFLTKGRRSAGDVLFVSGCDLEAPNRYRVNFQREQLEKRGYNCGYCYYTKITVNDIELYDVIYLYRVPFTLELAKIIELAKEYNKLVIYDTDDIVFEKSLLYNKHEIIAMSGEEKEKYFDGVERMKKMMQLCDYGVASTDMVARYMRKYIDTVIINRNSISDKLVRVSDNVYANKNLRHNRNREDNHVSIGYFSGSKTHDGDLLVVKNVLIRILKKYKNVTLYFVGDMEIDSDLKKYSNQIIQKNFISFWKGYQQLLSDVDINIAPLLKNDFNDGKSELKFTEAALVRVPTVASATEQFQHAIEDGVTGFVCKNEDAWFRKLSILIEDKERREKVGRNAYNAVKEKYVTDIIGGEVASLIEKYRKKKILYVTPSTNISGGMVVIAQHLRALQQIGYNVTLVSQDISYDMSWKRDFTVPIIHTSAFKEDIKNCDVVVATFWDTVKFTKNTKAQKKYYLVQNKEYLFYNQSNPFYAGALESYNSAGLQFLTVSKWCQKWLKEEFGKESQYIPNCIDTNLFNESVKPFVGKSAFKTRILIEGNSENDYKNIDEAFHIVNQLDKEKFEVWFISYGGSPKGWYEYDRAFQKIAYFDMPKYYASCDILLKTSKLESFSYPPLEMMACGGSCVVAHNEGNAEYLANNENALVYKVGDIKSAVSKINQLAHNTKMIASLKRGGRITVRDRSLAQLNEKLKKIYDTD